MAAVSKRRFREFFGRRDMANLLINRECNRKCPYCFAQSAGDAAPDTQRLSFDNLVRVLDFLEASGQKSLNILGGEPSLHPDFAFFLRYVLGRGFTPLVFSTGMISQNTLHELGRIISDLRPAPGGLRFVINVNHPGLRSPQEERMQARTFRALGRWCSQSCNIYQPAPQLDYLLANVREYGLSSEIRVGLAQPVAKGGNEYLALADYPRAMAAFMDFARACRDEGVALALDCGFPLCLFDDADLGLLFRSRSRMQFSCGPCLDIGPDLTVRYCYPMTNAGRVALGDYDNLDQVATALKDMVRSVVPQKGVWDKCRDCAYLQRGQCAGGCKAHLGLAANT